MSAPKTPPAMGPREWILLLALSVLWGGSFFYFKVIADIGGSDVVGEIARATPRDSYDI